MSGIDPYAGVVGARLGGGRYIIGDRMDEGGMGAVFRAADTARGDSAAIKVLHPDLAKETRHIARFYREAEAAMQLRHPHIVETRSIGGPEDDYCWFAMELLVGASLHQRQERGQSTFPPAEVIRIGRQILSALEASHGVGVLHRDLKPGNVMLEDRPEGSVAKLVDFGIAVFTSSETYTRLTATGMILGTPAYMPPEQVCGDALDARTDVYSLAATLHTILVGEPPYGRGTWGEILPKILTGVRTRLEHRGVDRPLASVIEQGLAVDPDARWGSAREMELALSALDAASSRTILEWHPPPELKQMQLVPFDDTGPGFAETVQSDLPGPFPSTREQPSSEPPPMAPTPQQPSSRPPPPDEAPIHASPESVIALPISRGRTRAVAAVALVGVLLVVGVAAWALGGSDDGETPGSVRTGATPDAPEAPAEPEVAQPAPTPVLPVGAEPPPDPESDEASPERARRVDRRRRGSSRRQASAAPASTMEVDLDEWKDEEAPASSMEVVAATAPEESPAPAGAPSAIMVNVVSGGAMSVRAVAPGQAPAVGETPGTHGPMVTYRTHRR